MRVEIKGKIPKTEAVTKLLDRIEMRQPRPGLSDIWIEGIQNQNRRVVKLIEGITSGKRIGLRPEWVVTTVGYLTAMVSGAEDKSDPDAAELRRVLDEINEVVKIRGREQRKVAARLALAQASWKVHSRMCE